MEQTNHNLGFRDKREIFFTENWRKSPKKLL
jgi:hypothetical protein